LKFARITALAGSIALAGAVMAAPALAANASVSSPTSITHMVKPDIPLAGALRYDQSFLGIGNDLSSGGHDGDTVIFSASGGGDLVWQYDAKGKNIGGTYFEIHPSDNSSLCVTASTTGGKTIVLVTCVGSEPGNQLWWNPSAVTTGGTAYHDENLYNEEFLQDPSVSGGGSARFTASGTYGYNGQSFYQTVA
jgi:hypothetical protein